MTEIIGVQHSGHEIENAVTAYIDAHYPNLESIMLELPLQWKRFNYGFFDPIALHYESKGARIIPGDTRRHLSLAGLTLEEAIEMGEKNPNRLRRKERLGLWKGFLSGETLKRRNEAMQECLQKEQPQVVVVGGAHAQYLKQRNPDFYFTFFREKSLATQFLYSPFIHPDETYAIPVEPYDSRNSNKYKEKFIRSLVSAGITVAGIAGLSLLDLSHNAKIIVELATLNSAFGILNNSKGAYWYLKALKEKYREEGK